MTKIKNHHRRARSPEPLTLVRVEATDDREMKKLGMSEFSDGLSCENWRSVSH